MLHFSLPGLSARAIRNLARPATRWGQRVLIRGGAAITARTGLAWFAAETDFLWVRPWYANATTSTLTIDKTTIQASAGMASLQPVDAGGAVLPMLPVYANAAGLEHKPGEVSGSALALAIPAPSTNATLAAANPAFACGDWTKCPSIPRADGSFRPLLQVRSYNSGAATLINEVDKDAWDDPAVHLGRIIDLYDGGGDQSAAASPAMAEVIRCYVAGLEFLGPRMVQSVLCIGDSETEGNMSTSGRRSWGHIVTAALSTANRPVSHINAGWTAQTTQQFVDRGIQDIRRFLPSVVCFPGMSPNDFPTAMAVVQNGFENCLRLANAAREAGAIPIFWTSFPTNGRTAAQDAPRQWLNATLRGLRSNGWLVADFDAAISNGGNPASILPAFDSGDGLHLNDAGWNACAAVMQPVLGQALSL